eukprot:TRINITY_DN32214_c0_g1_i1.p1 TRINITY_DN32214_c0_g1~~TRINITY_DN32214_c0_g1_i1.p1  ORF type:complete len:344 (-),score=45.37 TRINITY_DN32214_c0_g1_i1:1236-2186(-)
MSTVAAEFGFSGPARDEMLGGVVAVVFFSTGAVTSLVAGRLADMMSRSRLVSCFLLLGSAGTFLNSRVSSFAGLLLCRAAAGAATGGLLPASFATIGDLYAADERPNAIAVLTVFSGFGPALGQGLAGFLGPEAGWRAPFAVVGLAAFCLALLLLFCLQDPASRNIEGEEAYGKNSSTYCSSLRLGLAKPSTILTCLQGVSGCVPWAVITTFMVDYLAVDAHLGVQGSTGVLMTFGCGCWAGTVLGGRIGQSLYRRDKRLQVLFMAVTVWGGMLPLLALFFAAGSWGGMGLSHLFVLLGGLLASVAGCNAKAGRAF